MKKEKEAKYLPWLDLEMTGLDPNQQTIIEIATVITDNQMNVVAEGPVIAIYQDVGTLDKMETWSRDTHTKSGLLQRVIDSKITLKEAEEETLKFLSGYCIKQQSPLCGNSVYHDRRFLTRYMPTLAAFFHYRNIDVSTVKELVRRWYPHGEYDPQKKASHLALDDIRESIRELQYYRERFFMPANGLSGSGKG